jgi:hypothetical protein
MKGRSAANPALHQAEALPSIPGSGFVVLDGEAHYRIAGYQHMQPFLASIPSDTDLWMFIASGGGLTAGRVDADGALFPYRTVDELHDAHHHTGPLTLIRVQREGQKPVLWEPFSAAGADDSARERNLYKNATGNRLVFEECHRELGLTFRYAWSACDEFGLVRSASLENTASTAVAADLLDGLRNVLPFGAPLSLYQQAGNLVDAYKKTEVDADTGLAIFSLTAGITDRAEAVEVLRANTVWCCGLEEFRVHLSLGVVDAFRQDRLLAEETLLNGARGNYLVSSRLNLVGGQSARWHLLGDTGRDHLQIADLRQTILAGGDIKNRVSTGLRLAGENLRRNVASADGLQLSGRAESWSHHFANVLFNNMRGGVFVANSDLPVADLVSFLKTRNAPVADRQKELLESLPDTVTVQELHSQAGATGDADFQRLCHEYLPLHFGRRHGDPSRPWNRFSINVRDRVGERALSYAGNWRDIFQNWEALAMSFPGFLPSIVAKFINASTVDGFNPYRVNRDGVDWEVVSPEDPWSNIGYWGDHQIIYLLKLLEAWQGHDPSGLETQLGAAVFSYANVPYRLKPYADLLRDPSNTIDFDDELAAIIEERVASLGTDGKLVVGADGSVHHANLFEKLLVPVLSKLSNLIPDAGIWMNTQRPEWNDANNALAGGGVSVVTLAHLRRYLDFLARLLERTAEETLPVAAEVSLWFEGIETALDSGQDLLKGTELTPGERKGLLDALGEAYSSYREKVYEHGFSGPTDLAVGRAAQLCRAAMAYLDWGLAANRRTDGLFHTYNVLSVTEDGSGLLVSRLQEMLEGQVAALTSGVLTPAESLDIMDRLYAGALYRPDQRSFMLYPEKELPRFLDRNVVPAGAAAAVPLLADLLEAGDRSLLARDADGICRFHGDLRHAADLAAVLDQLGAEPIWQERVNRDREAVLEVFESVFHHRSYTGRSGTMYGYEGLGCIYWHMVAKLLLAVQETAERAERENAPAEVREGLNRMYYRVRAGIGYEKSAAEYGAFPTDPYSHTPPSGGAKQPGMTGQVKEEILTRRGELGILVNEGAIRFQPALLRREEFLGQPAEFVYFDTSGRTRTIDLPAGSLVFTLCQVPVVYHPEGNGYHITVTFADGATTEVDGNALDTSLSAEIFARNGRIDLIKVTIPSESPEGS